ncbi:hypothetical protein PsorP6_002170 [Peronosclerospora sorghi]|uniref:Uncharacterized protein n=1 Tax=Peronosclerospora sorghi TaxID=230839 RepID=A0ACC0WVD6_9STRA|nr:hypothetical protein PsorP6_002170 [Peronosclerospora sorghi]
MGEDVMSPALHSFSRSKTPDHTICQNSSPSSSTASSTFKFNCKLKALLPDTPLKNGKIYLRPLAWSVYSAINSNKFMRGLQEEPEFHMAATTYNRIIYILNKFTNTLINVVYTSILCTHYHDEQASKLEWKQQAAHLASHPRNNDSPRVALETEEMLHVASKANQQLIRWYAAFNFTRCNKRELINCFTSQVAVDMASVILNTLDIYFTVLVFFDPFNAQKTVDEKCFATLLDSVKTYKKQGICQLLKIR